MKAWYAVKRLPFSNCVRLTYDPPETLVTKKYVPSGFESALTFSVGAGVPDLEQPLVSKRNEKIPRKNDLFGY
jgi:hypothetical protein